MYYNACVVAGHSKVVGLAPGCLGPRTQERSDAQGLPDGIFAYPKIPILECYKRPLNGRFNSILWPAWYFQGRLVYVFYGHLGIFCGHFGISEAIWYKFPILI
jgi:hypothetical protein